MPQQFIISFLKKQQLTDDTYSFYFTRPQDFDFLAGQYNRMILPIENPDDRGTSRFFSISSSPLEKNHLVVTTRIIYSSFKKRLLSLQPGEEIRIFGPLGRFVLHEQDVRPHVLLAGGIGITPYHSMIQYAKERGLHIQITLFVSHKTPEEMVWHEQFVVLEKEHDWFKYIPTITRPEESKTVWNGETGRIDEEKLQRHAMDLSNALVYVVGSPAMVIETEELVKNMNVPEEQIKIEQFTGY